MNCAGYSNGELDNVKFDLCFSLLGGNSGLGLWALGYAPLRPGFRRTLVRPGRLTYRARTGVRAKLLWRGVQCSGRSPTEPVRIHGLHGAARPETRAKLQAQRKAEQSGAVGDTAATEGEEAQSGAWFSLFGPVSDRARLYSRPPRGGKAGDTCQFAGATEGRGERHGRRHGRNRGGGGAERRGHGLSGLSDPVRQNAGATEGEETQSGTVTGSAG
jgi:hypothetical protein